MGMACSCRRQIDIVKSVQSANTVITTRRASSEHYLVGENGLRRLEELYGDNIERIPRKLRFYLEKVIAGSHVEVKEIVLRLFNLGEYGAKCLYRLIPFYSHVKGLTLWKVGLALDSVRSLTESLVLIQGLEILGIEGNELRDECLLCLSRSFKLMTGLKELWLSSNQFTPVGAIVLANSLNDLPKLVLLNLDFNFLGSEGCRTLCRALIPRQRLKVLSLRANQIDSGAMEELVSLGNSNPPVETFNLEGNQLTEANCTELSVLYGPEMILLSGQCPPS